MSIPPSPRTSDWQATRVPKLTYRKPLAADEPDYVAPSYSKSPRPAESIGRTDSSRSSGSRSTDQSVVAPTIVPAKKKNSFLGGLFAKEPTMTALAQVEAELKAKHGAATAEKVPHVSSQKMPQHVPKVNSKWDGVPEAIKAREREERRTRKLGTHGSVRSDTVRSRSAQRGSERRSSYATSNADSFQSRARRNSYVSRPESAYSSTSEELIAIRPRRPASARSQSLRSPSGSSLPEIKSYFQHSKNDHTAPVPQVESRYVGGEGTKPPAVRALQSGMPSKDNRTQMDEAVPDHSSSPITTPRETSPITPSYQSDGTNFAPRTASETEASSPQRRAAANHRKIVPMGAFLAGEARPVTLEDNTEDSHSDLPLRRYQHGSIQRVEQDMNRRPDSSRGRLGLRASMIVETDDRPWTPQNAPSGQESLAPVSPQSKGRFSKKLALFR